MSAEVAIGLALALAASLALNTGFLLQHGGAGQAPPVTPLRPIATIAGLFRQRIWLLGLALGLSGWALHIAALAHAPLSLVQAFVAGGLALVAPVASRWFGQRLRTRERAAVAGMAGGLVLLTVGIREPSPSASLPTAGLLVFIGVCALGAAALAVRPLAARLAIAAGLLYGAADTAIKVLTLVDARHGLGDALLSPWLIAAAATTAGAFFAFQRALQVGRPVTSIALMTAGTYAVSIAAGVAVLGEPLGHGALGTVHALAFAAVVVAAWVLAPLTSAETRAEPATAKPA